MGVGAGRSVASESDITGTRAAEVDWFTSDLSPLTPEISNKKPAKFVLQISISASAAIEIALDGTNYSMLNDGTALSADTLYRFALSITYNDLFNMRTVSGSPTVTVDICRIEEYPGEA